MGARGSQDDQGPRLWIEEGETRSAPLVTVAPLAPLDKLYTFTATPEVLAQIRLGRRVIVPFGRRGRLARAFVVGLDTGPWSSTLKNVHSVLDPAGELSPHLLELGRWISQYYCCPLGRTLAAMLPQAVRRQRGFAAVRRVRLNTDAAALLAGRLGPAQRRVLTALATAGQEVETTRLLAEAGATRATLRDLVRKGWVAETLAKEAPIGAEDGVTAEPEFELNAAQQEALARITELIAAGGFHVPVLFGVSGSGKTEVYVRAMRHALTAGRQAIMLVPEIALTTQLVQRLAARFPQVAVIHSGLTEAQRSLEWEQIRTGSKPVVIGTRSAVFAPCPELGLIVVDEEQETGYKNLQAPRFHVRDVAAKRAQLLGIPLLLGSATPALETWYNVQKRPVYERINLPRRVRELPMPAVQIVDTGGLVLAEGHTGSVSPPLRQELARVLEKQAQAIILLNRRGYAARLQCPTCRRSVQCPNCQASMVLHQSRASVVCHYCNARVAVPRYCPDPSCQAPLVLKTGGTERLEEELQRLFPRARIHRADSDSMTHADKYRRLVDDFTAGKIDILVGTQMIAKGLDFPRVALVGVIGGDPAAAMSDFRAGERLFQLVTQVAGRAGRADLPGRVIVQTATPDLPALRFASTYDYEGFAAGELARRALLHLPPCTRLARCVMAGKPERIALEEAGKLAERMRATAEACGVADALVLGPHPCAVERVRGLYRFEVLLRAAGSATLVQVLTALRQSGALRQSSLPVMVDVDPVSLS